MKKVFILLLFFVSFGIPFRLLSAQMIINDSFCDRLSKQLLSCAVAVKTDPYEIPSIKKFPKQDPIAYTPVSKVHMLNESRLGPEFSYGVYMIENIRGGNNLPAYPCQDTAFVGSLVGKAFFGVFDGHGKFGERIAEEAAKNIPLNVLKHKGIEQGIKAACKTTQERYRQAMYAQRSGTTLVCGVIQGKELVVGNVGDSRLVVIRPSRNSIAFSTIDHKGVPGRLLALGRSLGDIEMHKLYGLSSEPELTRLVLEENDVLIFASDGYWDVVTNQQTYELVMQGIAEGIDSKALAKKLAETARIRKSKDDITVLCVRYKKISELQK